MHLCAEYNINTIVYIYDDRWTYKEYVHSLLNKKNLYSLKLLYINLKQCHTKNR